MKCDQLFIHTSDFLLIIIIVTGGEELSKDQSWYIDLLHLVLHNRNTFPIVPNNDGVIFTKRKKGIIYKKSMLLCPEGCSEMKHGASAEILSKVCQMILSLCYLHVNADFNAGHALVPLLVVSCIY